MTIKINGPVAHECEGCDGYDDYPTAPYMVTHHDGTTARVHYCEDCAGLAECDWNGETASIREASA